MRGPGRPSREAPSLASSSRCQLHRQAVRSASRHSLKLRSDALRGSVRRTFRFRHYTEGCAGPKAVQSPGEIPGQFPPERWTT
jgi:hypothetical protein